MIKENITLEADWISMYSINIYSNDEEGGSVFGTGYYLPGDKVSISVLANEKYTFDGWCAFIIPITPDMLADCQEAAKHIVNLIQQTGFVWIKQFNYSCY